MGWETRRSGGRYFTTTHRVAGRFVRRYWGGAVIGELAAALFAQRRLEREQQARREKVERERLREAVAPLQELCEATDLLTRASLLAAGFWQHARGEWRRRLKMTGEVVERGAVLAGPGDLAELARRVQAGDAGALSALRATLERKPEVWRRYGDLAAHAQEALVRHAAGDNPIVAESLRLKAEEIKTELAGPAPTPLERLLAERGAACWLQVGYFDALSAANPEVSPRQAEVIRRNQDSASRRYLAALRALAVVRRLLAPAAKAGPKRRKRREAAAGTRVGPTPA
jgi:hypothetical protein